MDIIVQFAERTLKSVSCVTDAMQMQCVQSQLHGKMLAVAGEISLLCLARQIGVEREQA